MSWIFIIDAILTFEVDSVQTWNIKIILKYIPDSFKNKTIPWFLFYFQNPLFMSLDSVTSVYEVPVRIKGVYFLNIFFYLIIALFFHIMSNRLMMWLNRKNGFWIARLILKSQILTPSQIVQRRNKRFQHLSKENPFWTLCMYVLSTF